MKKLYFLFTLLITTSMSFGQSVFINEIHYDNTGGDLNEGVEIAGPAGTDVSGYVLEFYNGSSSPSSSYNTETISGTLSGTSGSGMGVLWVSVSGIQNGSPDGIALSSDATSDGFIQFLSYEGGTGTMTTVVGIAAGETSENIGVTETSATAVGFSLQLIGTGTDYTDFTWSSPIAHTRDLENTGQVLPVAKNEIANFSTYPNPVTNGAFFINSASSVAKEVQIFDMLGKQVYAKNVTANESVNVANLNTGIYILKVIEEGKTATRKLVIK